MRPKSGLKKRKALRNMPEFSCGFSDHPEVLRLRVAEKKFNARSQISVVSMFAGCGGMDLGFAGGFSFLDKYYSKLPFYILRALEIDDNAVATYRLNMPHDVEVCDLTNIDMATLPSADVLLGGFPCQDFSSCGPKTGFEGKRGRLYRVMVEYAELHKPGVIVAENVPHLAKLQEGRLLQEIVGDFEEVGYDVRVWTLYCPDYGLPQNRTRLIFVGVRKDIAAVAGRPSAPAPAIFQRPVAIDDAIDDLESITDETIPNQSQYFVATKATKGAGQGDQVSLRGQVAYAVRANPKARVHFHYELPRRLTVRECARIQSFPDQFVFPFSTSTNMMQIGNAVPPIIGHAVAEEIAHYLAAVRKKGIALQCDSSVEALAKHE